MRAGIRAPDGSPFRVPKLSIGPSESSRFDTRTAQRKPSIRISKYSNDMLVTLGPLETSVGARKRIAFHVGEKVSIGASCAIGANGNFRPTSISL